VEVTTASIYARQFSAPERHRSASVLYSLFVRLVLSSGLSGKTFLEALPSAGELVVFKSVRRERFLDRRDNAAAFKVRPIPGVVRRNRQNEPIGRPHR
jgi:hypothetical protein